jgi:hypothetical protein
MTPCRTKSMCTCPGTLAGSHSRLVKPSFLVLLSASSHAEDANSHPTFKDLERFTARDASLGSGQLQSTPCALERNGEHGRARAWKPSRSDGGRIPKSAFQNPSVSRAGNTPEDVHGERPSSVPSARAKRRIGTLRPLADVAGPAVSGPVRRAAEETRVDAAHGAESHDFLARRHFTALPSATLTALPPGKRPRGEAVARGGEE